MRKLVSRRALLAMLMSAGSAAMADAPLVSLRPTARPTAADRVTPEMRQTLAQVVAASEVTGHVGIVVADAQTGEIIDQHEADIPQPPASVTKAVTAVYALEGLGADFRFKTRIIAKGSISGGILDGDLTLVGGGDPNLITDDLAVLAERLKATGLKEVRGSFHVYDGALPNLDEIDAEQLDYLGYNPAITGLNLNYNRVHFEWKKHGSNYSVTMDARSDNYRPDVTVATMQIVNREVPTFTYADGGNLDNWTVARGALSNGGSRWLPVRYPALYAGEVFAAFARSHGIVLQSPVEVPDLPDGVLLASFDSPPLSDIMRDMLKYSTNITAEAAGMTSTEKRTGQKRGLRTSALGMTQWAKTRAGISPQFADHSGLSDASRISAADMVGLLTAGGAKAQLFPIMKDIAFKNEDGQTLKDHPAKVLAKTGTLNFVACLAGYLRTAGGRDLAFAIFAADLDAREKGKLSQDEQPFGSISFNTNAKRLQQVLLQRWAVLADLLD